MSASDGARLAAPAGSPSSPSPAAALRSARSAASRSTLALTLTPGSRPGLPRRATRLRPSLRLRLDNLNALAARGARRGDPRFTRASVQIFARTRDGDVRSTTASITKFLHSIGVQSAFAAASLAQSLCRPAANGMRSYRRCWRRLDAGRAPGFRLRRGRASRIRRRSPFRSLAGHFGNSDEAGKA